MDLSGSYFLPFSPLLCICISVCFYRTRVRSLSCLVSNSLTDSLTHCRLVNLIDVTLACKDTNSKGCFCCWSWWWGSSWQQFVADLEAEAWSQSLTFVQTLSALVKILKLKLRRDLKLIFGQYFADVWLRLRSWIIIKILKLSLVKILSLVKVLFVTVCLRFWS